jgi:hypothetical protein
MYVQCFFLKRKGSGMQSDTKFGQKGGVSYTNATTKRFQNAVLVCILLERSITKIPLCMCMCVHMNVCLLPDLPNTSYSISSFITTVCICSMMEGVTSRSYFNPKVGALQKMQGESHSSTAKRKILQCVHAALISVIK